MPASDRALIAQLRAVIAATFPEPPTPFDDSADLVGLGILGSLGSVELVLALEATFGVRFEPHEIVPSSFASVQQIATLIEQKRTRG